MANTTNGRVRSLCCTFRSEDSLSDKLFPFFVQPLSECPMSDSDGEGGKGRGIFHRSVSMSTGAPWTRNSNDGRVVMMRKRNNSSSEMNTGL